MKKRKTMISLAIIALVLVLGIGYATVADIPLNIVGSLSASADAEFEVKFVEGSESTEGAGTKEASITSDTEAEFSVSDLTTKGQTASVTYEIENVSPSLTANLSAVLTNTNEDWFSADYYFGEESEKTAELAPENGKTTVTIEVELLDTPLTDEEAEEATATVTLALTASPVQK